MDLGVLERVRQLNEWRNDQDAPRRGVYVYSLDVSCRKLGQLARQAKAKASRPLCAAVRGMDLPRRLLGCLSAAIQDAQPGDRNNFGHWLTCRCTDAGLSEGETIKVMEVYRSNRQPGLHAPRSSSHRAVQVEAEDGSVKRAWMERAVILPRFTRLAVTDHLG